MPKKKNKRPTRRPVGKANKALAKVHGLKTIGRGDAVKSGKLKRIPLAQLRRDRLKLTKLGLRETAKVLELSAGFYSMIETGKRKPGLKVACRIAEYYGYTVEQLWGKVKL
jgi:DNA-binding XRE family transcriptional regulator